MKSSGDCRRASQPCYIYEVELIYSKSINWLEGARRRSLPPAPCNFMLNLFNAAGRLGSRTLPVTRLPRSIPNPRR
jgi:hypothetical protein